MHGALRSYAKKNESMCLYVFFQGGGVNRAKLNPSKFGCNARARYVVTVQRSASQCVCVARRRWKKTFMYVNSLPPECMVSAVLGELAMLVFPKKSKNHYRIRKANNMDY